MPIAAEVPSGLQRLFELPAGVGASTTPGAVASTPSATLKHLKGSKNNAPQGTLPKLRAPIRPPPQLSPVIPIGWQPEHVVSALPSLASLPLEEQHIERVLRKSRSQRETHHKPPCVCKLDGAMYPYGRCRTYRDDFLRRNPMPDSVTGKPPPVEGTSKGRYHHDEGCVNHATRKRSRAP